MLDSRAGELVQHRFREQQNSEAIILGKLRPQKEEENQQQGQEERLWRRPIFL